MSSEIETEAEREIDLGRAASSIAARWWLVLAATALGVVVGYLVSLGGGDVYQGKATIYLGQPLSATGASQVQSYQTNPSTVNQLARSPALVADVAARVGLPPAQLRAGISTRAVPGATVRVGQTPLFEVIVRGPFQRKVADAANLIAEGVVDEVSVYPDEKIRTLERLQASQETQLATLDRTIQDYVEAAAEPELAATDKFVLVTLASLSEQRRATLVSDLAQTELDLSVAREVERGRVVDQAVSSKVAARSKRSAMVVGGVVGLIVGLALALAWPRLTRRRAQREAAET